jgi:hypothetical protein
MKPVFFLSLFSFHLPVPALETFATVAISPLFCDVWAKLTITEFRQPNPKP